MAIYVMSDLHGFYDKYMQFINDTSFNKEDILYIIGDAINRGKDGIKLIQDIMKRKNVYLIKGNHESMILPVLNELVDCKKEDQPSIIIHEVTQSSFFQGDTLNDFCRLTSQEQKKIIHYLSNLPLYVELTIKSKSYLLVHAGLPYFTDMDIKFYSETELLFGPHDFSITHYEDKTIIVGHTPTRFIEDALPDKIYRSYDSICIDCGLGFGGGLGVLCLDTNEEMYF